MVRKNSRSVQSLAGEDGKAQIRGVVLEHGPLRVLHGNSSSAGCNLRISMRWPSLGHASYGLLALEHYVQLCRDDRVMEHND